MAAQVTNLVWEHNIFVLNAEVVVETVEKQSHACEQCNRVRIHRFQNLLWRGEQPTCQADDGKVISRVQKDEGT